MTENKFICSFLGCDKTFKKKFQLIYHNRTHTGERPYICDWKECNKTYISKADLNKHKKNHTREIIYKCEWKDCNREFIEKGVLTNHIRSHTGERPYKCDWIGCNKEYMQSNELLNHKKNHTGERPYKCDWYGCNKDFKTSSNLTIHKRYHTGERPYSCDWPECKQTFYRPNHLERHKRYHTGEKPYKCEIENCERTFNCNEHLKIHTERWHTERGKQIKKKSEEYTARLLEKEGIDFKREHQVSFSCNRGTFCKIDFVHIKKGIIFAIENDEHQHETYSLSCELKRMTDVKSVFIQEGNTMPLVWIRYNPDTFFKGKNKVNINKKDRLNKVINLINKLSEIPENILPLNIYYCFYDTNENGSLCIFDDPEFNIELKSMCYCIS